MEETGLHVLVNYILVINKILSAERNRVEEVAKSSAHQYETI